MNAPEFFSPDLAIPAEFRVRFDAQREAFLKAPEPSHAERLADLRALTRLLKKNQRAIVAAIDADYGGRSEFETMFGEIFASLDGLRDAQKRLARWMRPRRRSVDALLYPGARNGLIPQPLGVVGVIGPGSCPIVMSCAAVSRGPPPAEPPGARRRARAPTPKLSNLPELRAVHRRGCRGKPSNGQH